MIIDPNLVYLILIVGLWMSVTAAYIPGTGAAEILAVVGVVSFLVIPFLNRRYAPLALGGLVLQALGSLFLFNGLSVSLPLIVVTIIAALIYHRFALMRTLDYHRSKPAMLEDEPIAGQTGYVQSALDPVGTVYVRGESWTARSDHKLEAGTEISVVEQDGLTLYVEAIKQKRQPEEA